MGGRLSTLSRSQSLSRLACKVLAPTPAATTRPDVEEDDDMPPLEPVPEVCGVCMDEVELLVLDCQHSFCQPCLEQQLAAGSSGSRITFGYLNCGFCRAPLAHKELESALARHQRLREKVLDVAEAQFRKEKLEEKMRSDLAGEPSASAVRAQAEAEMAVYRCSSCSKIFCAGRADCAAALAEEGDSLGRSILCPTCEWPQLSGQRCERHGREYAIFKCDFCCSLAVWSCGGTAHYCDHCHSHGGIYRGCVCPGPERCPLGMKHPDNIPRGASRPLTFSSFVVGCLACMGLQDHKHALAEIEAFSDMGGDSGDDDEADDPPELEDVVLRREWRESARAADRGRKEARQKELLRRGRRAVRKPAQYQQQPQGRTRGRR